MLASVNSGQAQSSEHLVNQTLGLEISKPAKWVHLTAEENAKNLNEAFKNDAEFQNILAKYATIPIFAFTKFPEPYTDLNPSIKINARPIGDLAGKTGGELLASLAPVLSKIYPDFKIEQSPQDSIIGGKAAAYVRFHYTLVTNEAQFPTTSELWVVPNGPYFLMIGAGTRQDEATGTREEIHSILSTIRIAPQDH